MATKRSLKKLTAVLFDMDGLLLDTETPSKLAWRRAASQFGRSIGDDVLSGLIGRHVDDCVAIVGECLDLDLRESGFMERYDDIYLSNFMRNGIDVMTGAIPLLDALVEREVPRAVVTSSELELAPRKLKLAGIDHYFDLVVTGCEVERSKPDPDIFLLAAEKLGIAPEECLVFEDSYNGIRAAHRAGMNPVMVPDILPPTDEIKELAVEIFSSLEEAVPFVTNRLE